MAKQAKRSSGKRAAAKGTTTKRPAAKSAKKAASAKPSAFQMPDWINNAMTSPLMREAAAAALIAGAGAAAAVLARRHGPSGRKIRSAAAEAANATKDFADAAVDAFAGAASDTVRGLLPGERDGDGENSGPASARRGKN